MLRVLPLWMRHQFHFLCHYTTLGRLSMITNFNERDNFPTFALIIAEGLATVLIDNKRLYFRTAFVSFCVMKTNIF